MKRLAFALAVLLLVTSCLFAACESKTDPGSETTVSEQPSESEEVTSSVPQTDLSAFKISDFRIVSGANLGAKLKTQISDLKMAIKEYTGTIIGSAEDTRYSPKKCEIIVGSAENQRNKEICSTLSGDRYAIVTDVTQDSMRIYICANTEKGISSAISEFERQITLGEIFDKEGRVISMIEKEGEGVAVLSGEEQAQIVIIYKKTANSNLKNAIDLLESDISKAVGGKIEKIAAEPGTDYSGYKYSIIIGDIDETSNQLQSKLGDREYRLKSETIPDGYRVYLVGKKDIDLQRAIQRFYTLSVVDRKLGIPTYINEKITSLYGRDPFILKYDGKYYLYQSTGTGFGVRTSSDLLSWSDIKKVFDKSDDKSFNGTDQFWAPECHYYNGAFYMFASFKDTNGFRGTAIFRSESPDGHFTLWSDRHITPKGRHSIDGTLYIDNNGTPYLVYVDEWPNYENTGDDSGFMRYVELTPDLKSTVGEPQVMFNARDPKWTSERVTDGPFMYRTSDGNLIMIWSNFSPNGYSVGVVKSSNGEIDGEWIHESRVLFNHNFTSVYTTLEGGHGMILEGYDGRSYLILHTPNSGDDIAVTAIPIIESNGTIILDTIK